MLALRELCQDGAQRRLCDDDADDAQLALIERSTSAPGVS
jgi:hypothetical protein